MREREGGVCVGELEGHRACMGWTSSHVSNFLNLTPAEFKMKQ